MFWLAGINIKWLNMKQNQLSENRVVWLAQA
jgi:hypothetical protein